jgi:hypothetical protein
LPNLDPEKFEAVVSRIATRFDLRGNVAQQDGIELILVRMAHYPFANSGDPLAIRLVIS